MANTDIYRVPSSNGNRRLFCFSAWIKLTGTTGERTLFAAGADSDVNGYFNILIGGDHHLYVEYYQGGYQHVYTNAKYRDYNSWYHIMVQVATGEGTASNRIKMYVNGEQVTSLGSTDYPSNDYDFKVNQSGETQSIGRARNSSGGSHNYFDGVMSHVHMVDGGGGSGSGGVCLPTDFGSVDSTTGEWKINTSPSVTYGTNGFFILKDDNALTDRSGQSNNFTANGGTLTKTEDCPGNVFATWNPLSRSTGNVYSNGNTTVSYQNNYQKAANATLAFNNGKYYGEFKRTGAANLHVGIVGNTFLEDGRIVTDTSANHTYNMRGHTGCITLITNSGDQDIFVDGSDSGTNVDFNTASGDIVMVAFDADTKKIWFGKNGTWSGSGNPASGANPSLTYSGTATSNFTFGVDTENGSVCLANFGNGKFGTTSVSSAGTNASGIGIFEYDVPTGYTALSTKGLNL